MSTRDWTIRHVPRPRWTIYFDADGEMLEISAVRDGLHPDAIAVEVVAFRPEWRKPFTPSAMAPYAPHHHEYVGALCIVCGLERAGKNTLPKSGRVDF